MGGVAAGTSPGVVTGESPGVVTGETLGSVAEEKTLRGGSRNPRRDDFLAPRVGVSPAGATLWRRGTAYPPPRDCVSPPREPAASGTAARRGAIQLGSADAEQVDHEDQGAAGELVPRTGNTVGEGRRHDELAASADFHARDALLPARD